MAKLKIKKNDEVIVLAGKDKGKKGEVLRVLPAENRAIVSGINQVKKHERQSATSQGGIVTKELPIHISNLAIVDPKENTATRVGYKTLENGKKVRIAKRSGEVLDN